jgi:hypothetical protein
VAGDEPITGVWMPMIASAIAWDAEAGDRRSAARRVRILAATRSQRATASGEVVRFAN